ncbi:uncharacterized protein BJX67DRAFT_339979 [Aspergillus lucknowensis]|uniref:Uncharacterized protein n=1 Tax=Aspergillus lucknowensis TaxID=176173 RepID=A0ABR4M7Q4_9EURO
MFANQQPKHKAEYHRTVRVLASSKQGMQQKDFTSRAPHCPISQARPYHPPGPVEVLSRG